MNNIFFYITPTIIRLVVVVLRLIGVYSVMEVPLMDLIDQTFVW